MKFRFSLDWLLIFVPIALVLRFVPAFSNPTALFICSAIAIIPVAGWIGHATEALAAPLFSGEEARSSPARLSALDKSGGSTEITRAEKTNNDTGWESCVSYDLNWRLVLHRNRG